MATILGVKDGLGLSSGPSLEGIITFKSMSREARHQGDGRWFLDPMLTVMLCCFKAFQGGPRLFNVFAHMAFILVQNISNISVA